MYIKKFSARKFYHPGSVTPVPPVVAQLTVLAERNSSVTFNAKILLILFSLISMKKRRLSSENYLLINENLANGVLHLCRAEPSVSAIHIGCVIQSLAVFSYDAKSDFNVFFGNYGECFRYSKLMEVKS